MRSILTTLANLQPSWGWKECSILWCINVGVNQDHQSYGWPTLSTLTRLSCLLMLWEQGIGIWHLVEGVRQMLNLFAATGHFNYAKSAWLYLQWMLELPEKHSWLHLQFSEHRFYSVWCSDHYWAGLSTDLIIEQMMRRSIKSRGGNKGLRNQWDWCGCIACTLMPKYMNPWPILPTEPVSSMYRWLVHIRREILLIWPNIFNWISQHNTFDKNQPELRSISSALTASDGAGINCDIAKETGNYSEAWQCKRFTELKEKKFSSVYTCWAGKMCKYWWSKCPCWP